MINRITAIELTCAIAEADLSKEPGYILEPVNQCRELQEFQGDTQVIAASKARAAGWRFSYVTNVALCPYCVNAGYALRDFKYNPRKRRAK